MTTKDTGGPAFPQMKELGDSFMGMSLRDYFAAMAMQGLLAHKGTFHPSDVYEAADAMLAERNKQ